MTEQEREELIEKMARAAWESDGFASWEEVRKNGKKLYLREARAALAVAEPVIREQAENALREENARLRRLVKTAYAEGCYDSTKTEKTTEEFEALWEGSFACRVILEKGKEG